MPRTSSRTTRRRPALYEEAVAADPVNEDLQTAYFFLGNSYDNLYKPSKKGDAGQRRAAEEGGRELPEGGREAAVRRSPPNKKLGKLSLEYLVASYGADKLNDPAKAEPVVQKMIQLEPGEPTNYFALAKIYEDAGAYDEAEQHPAAGEDAKPDDPTVYKQLAGYYNRQGQFDKTIDALAAARGQGTEQPRSVLHHLDLLLGQGLPRLHAEGNRKEGHTSRRASRRSTTRCRSSRTTWRRWSTRACSCGSRRTSKRTRPSSRLSSSRPTSCATRRRNCGRQKAAGV